MEDVVDEVPRPFLRGQVLSFGVEDVGRLQHSTLHLDHLSVYLHSELLVETLVVGDERLRLLLHLALPILGPHGGDADHVRGGFAVLQELLALRGDVADPRVKSHQTATRATRSDD